MAKAFTNSKIFATLPLPNLLFVRKNKKNFVFLVYLSLIFCNFGFAELTFRSEEQKKLRFSCFSLTYFVTLPPTL